MDIAFSLQVRSASEWFIEQYNEQVRLNPEILLCHLNSKCIELG